MSAFIVCYPIKLLTYYLVMTTFPQSIRLLHEFWSTAKCDVFLSIHIIYRERAPLVRGQDIEYKHM